MFKHLLFSTLIAALPVSAAQAELVSYWNFNETEGSVARDVANGHDGMLYDGANVYTAGDSTGSGPEFVAGRPDAGNALRLNDATHSGTTRDVVVLDNTPYNFGQADFTVSGWFNTDTIGSAHSAIIGNAIHNDSGFGAIVIREGLSTSGRLQFGVKGDGGSSNVAVLSNDRVDDGQWHWFAAIVEAQVITLYVDGVRQGSTTYGSSTDASPAEENTFIGGRKLHTDPFFGLVDDLSIFDHALTGELDGEGNLTGGELQVLYDEGPLAVPEPAAAAVFGAVGLAALLRRGER